MNSNTHPLILGVGNLLLGDEGIGVHAIRHLEAGNLHERARLLDGGTGGFHLLSLFQEYNPIILIDATIDGKPAGTVTLTHPKFASDFPRTLSAHDIGLRDLLESAQIIGPLPKLFLITVSIHDIQPMTMDLSPAVHRSLPQVVATLKQVLAEENLL